MSELETGPESGAAVDVSEPADAASQVEVSVEVDEQPAVAMSPLCRPKSRPPRRPRSRVSKRAAMKRVLARRATTRTRAKHSANRC